MYATERCSPNWFGCFGVPCFSRYSGVATRTTEVSAILATAPSGKAIAALVPGLAVRGKLIVVGVAPDPIEVSSPSLVFGGRSIYGSLTGSAIDTQDTLAFSVLQDVRPMIETLPLEKAPEAYARMMDGKARFSMVLVVGKDQVQVSTRREDSEQISTNL